MVYVDEKKMTTSVKISIEGMENLTKICESNGIMKIEMVSRVMNWLCNQDKSLQAIVLGQVDPADELAVLDLIRAKCETSVPDTL